MTATAAAAAAGTTAVVAGATAVTIVVAAAVAAAAFLPRKTNTKVFLCGKSFTTIWVVLTCASVNQAEVP